MDARIGFVLNNIIGEPRSGWFRETNVRHMNGKVLASANSDIANSAEIHDRFVGLLLNDDGIAGSTRITVTDIIYCNHPEEIFLALLQFRYGIHVVRYRSTVYVRPIIIAFSLLLNDIASDLRATVVSWRTPAQSHRVFGDSVRFRRLRCIRTHYRINDNMINLI